MTTEGTYAQIDSYQQNGFLLVEDLLTPQELGMWCEAVDKAV